MINELAGYLSTVQAAPSSDSSGGIVGIVIATVPTTITAVALLLGARRGRRPQDTPEPPLPPPPIPLNSDEIDIDDDADDLEIGNDPRSRRIKTQRRRIRVLERFLFLQGMNPAKVRTGDEAMTDVRIS